MIHNIQILRAFAALNVVYFHIIMSADSYDQPVDFFFVLDGWGASGVDIFFVISGFVMVLTQSVREKKALHFLTSRIIRIVPVYWFLTMCFILLYFVFPQGFRELKPNIMDTIYSLLFLSGVTGEDFPLLHVGWTLEYEMLFYLLFCIGIFFGRQNTLIFFPAVILGLLSFTGIVELLAIEFVLGMLCARLYLSRALRNLAVPALIVGLCWFLMTILFKVDLDRFFLFGIPSFFLVFGLANIKQSKNRLLNYVGDASYSIYLVQVFTIPIFYKFSSQFLSKLDGDLLSLFALIVTGWFGCLVYSFIEKPMTSLLKRNFRGS
jgi:exopolysaccharide production protein ExoZ